VRQLTNDRYGDLQPAWAPDGRTLAFVTDRGPGGTDFSSLTFGPPRLALYDLDTGSVEPLRPFERGLQHNPQFAPDGRGLYFISDHDGFKDVHYLDLASGRTTPITHLQTGVSGFSATSPAMTVAAQNGNMMFSVFADNEYAVAALSAAELADRRAEPAPPSAPVDTFAAPVPEVQADTLAPDTLLTDQAALLPPWTGDGVVDNALKNPTAGLPSDAFDDAYSYRPRLQLDAIAPPSIGISAGGGFGTRLGGSVGFYFSDMLGDHNLSVEALANGSLQDLGGQITYVNRDQRLNYGAQLAHIPFLSRSASIGVAQDPATGVVTRRIREVEERVFANQLNLLSAFPLQSTRRFEFQTGLTRYGFDLEVRDFYQYPDGFRLDESSLPTPDPLYLSQTTAAYVVDYSNFGFTSPVQGGRYRLQAGATLGSTQYATVLADLRQYVRVGLVTFAGRAVHIGNYGAEEGDLFSSEYLGYSFVPSYVRGYSFNSFDPEECTSADGSCAPLDRLVGTRVATVNAEVRIPFLGTEAYGLFDFPYLPTELAVFADAGLAWTAESAPVFAWDRDSEERVPVVSAGVSARMNLFGAAIVEIFYAQPFQRPVKGGFVGLHLLPGW
jgi:hypothetical protein